jgi:2Fe-2S ferredoxin
VAFVTVEPATLTFEVAPDETLLDAALRAGLRWPTVCGGAGACVTCHFIIREGGEHFSPQTDHERQALSFVRRRHADLPEDHVRMACQATVTGDAVVHCKGARAQARASTPAGTA